MSSEESTLKCPSAQPDFPQAQVLGVVEQAEDGPRLTYVAGTMPVTEELVASTAPVPPTLVMRIAGQCQTGGCVHYDGGACHLVKRIVDKMAPVVDALPACAIRPTCRWFVQEGAKACQRCPQVVTRIDDADPMMLDIAGEAPAA